MILAGLYNMIASKTGGRVIREIPNPGPDLSSLADNLLAHKGRSIVVSGTNNVDIQIIVNGINMLLGNYAGCIDLDR